MSLGGASLTSTQLGMDGARVAGVPTACGLSCRSEADAVL